MSCKYVGFNLLLHLASPTWLLRYFKLILAPVFLRRQLRNSWVCVSQTRFMAMADLAKQKVSSPCLCTLQIRVVSSFLSGRMLSQTLTKLCVACCCVSISPVSALLEGQEDQSILISGVSGAGKTETAKLLLGHLASVAGSEEGGVGSERIQHMVECTVVLESFGNAVMVRERAPHTDGVIVTTSVGLLQELLQVPQCVPHLHFTCFSIVWHAQLCITYTAYFVGAMCVMCVSSGFSCVLLETNRAVSGPPSLVPEPTSRACFISSSYSHPRFQETKIKPGNRAGSNGNGIWPPRNLGGEGAQKHARNRKNTT